MHKIALAAMLLFAFGAMVFNGEAVLAGPNGPTLRVVNNSTYSSISFGYNSYKVVNGSSTRQGSGATTSIGATGTFSSWPPLSGGDELYLDRGLRIASPDSSMNSDGSNTCDAAGFSQGISSVLGRGYMKAGDSFTVTVTRKQGVIPGIYDAECAYSR
ncbi:MAG: hypothetical protein K9K65_13605 [Desulfarculaceae bacterium]|nr:hypothetical protein [Desulfarculaceae bacterium]MCF8047807.1 hypothetical protein [Desulfarculaceae bacterium]MCF8098871.1 hypothetical protein [Desulfarculaceae bacterium]MCF8122990.1 hypothetical protein [Desulfarculaceae bacterium]